MVIDLDQMENRLELALTEGRTPPAGTGPPGTAPTRTGTPATPAAAAPLRRRQHAVVTPAPAVSPPPPAGPGAVMRELMELGRLDRADAEMAARAGRTTGATERRDMATWATMRALLDGRRDLVASGIGSLLDLARESGCAETWDRYWIQRCWAALEWGDQQERLDVLDHCRTRAYRFDDLHWWGSLTLLLATMGKVDEAGRAFDESFRLLDPRPHDGVWLDVVTNLIEAAATVGDAGRVGLAYGSLPSGSLARPPDRLVVVGPAVVCKGSVERYRALGLSAAGRGAEAAESFRLAADVHRSLGAGPLLDRTRRQAERFRRAA